MLCWDGVEGQVGHVCCVGMTWRDRWAVCVVLGWCGGTSGPCVLCWNDVEGQVGHVCCVGMMWRDRWAVCVVLGWCGKTGGLCVCWDDVEGQVGCACVVLIGMMCCLSKSCFGMVTSHLQPFERFYHEVNWVSNHAKLAEWCISSKKAVCFCVSFSIFLHLLCKKNNSKGIQQHIN